MNNIDFNYYFPKDFFSKEVNEPIQAFLIAKAFGVTGDYTKGDPNKGEPDVLIGDTWFEMTLACDLDHSIEYINSIRTQSFVTSNLEDVSIKCIKDSCFKKAQKHYLCKNKKLNILLTIPVYHWTWKAYSNLPDIVPKNRLDQLFLFIKEKYINSGPFDDVIITIPGFCYDWILFSALNQKLIKRIQLSDYEIASKKFPYVIKL